MGRLVAWTNGAVLHVKNGQQVDLKRYESFGKPFIDRECRCPECLPPSGAPAQEGAPSLRG